jgi:predicted nucleotidyltransferase
MSTEPDLEAIRVVVKRHLPAGEYHAYLFGSRATQRARPVSDWDIGILGPAPVRGAVLESIRDDLEDLPTLHTFDVVDLATVPDAFRLIALHEAVQLA